MNIDDHFDNIDEKQIDENLIIHLRLRKRNGRKCITIVENLEKIINTDLKKITKYFKKNLHCSATIKKCKTNDLIIELQGDHRKKITEILLKLGMLVDINQIELHGL